MIAAADNGPTGTEALLRAGYTHRPAADSRRMYAHDIVDASGKVVATLTAHEVWAWLATGEVPT